MIRTAKFEEIENIYDFLRNLHHENGLAELNRLRAYEAIVSCLNPKSGVVGIISDGEKIKSCIGLRINQSLWYADDWFLEELWNFVHPDYRRENFAKQMVEFAKNTAERLGIPLFMGIVTKKQLEPKLRLYQRQMTQIGAYFIHGKDFENIFQQRNLDNG
jgi:GNAT superfamily N-acetyltransferase